MTDPSETPLLLTALPPETQTLAKKHIKSVQAAMRMCEIYTRDYDHGTQNVVKTIQTMDCLTLLLEDLRSVLTKAHGFGDSPKPTRYDEDDPKKDD